ncbi:hypothetical protein Tco_1356393 [Tanacetum coccineum]
MEKSRLQSSKKKPRTANQFDDKPDPIPRPSGAPRPSKSQRSSNSSDTSGSQKEQFSDLVQQQIAIDQMSKLEQMESNMKNVCIGTNLIVVGCQVEHSKMVAPLPLSKELARVADSDVTKDQLIVLFEREVAKDAEKIMDFHKLSRELRAAIRRKDGYIAELRLYRSCDDTIGTIEMLIRMQLHDIKKDARLLLMARETLIKVDEKTGFIMRMRDRAVG